MLLFYLCCLELEVLSFANPGSDSWCDVAAAAGKLVYIELEAGSEGVLMVDSVRAVDEAGRELEPQSAGGATAQAQVDYSLNGPAACLVFPQATGTSFRCSCVGCFILYY